MRALSILGWLAVLWGTSQASAQKNYRDFAVLPDIDDVEWRFEMPEDVAAIGDTHGDPDALAAILEYIKFISPTGTWIAGKSHLVLMGDLVGKGPHSRANWELVLRLKAAAEKKGGRVHILLGNHELSVEDGLYATHFGQDDFSAYDEFAPFLSSEDKKRMSDYDRLLRGMKAMGVAWADPKSPYASELSTRNSILQIGDITFIHGGLSDYLFEAPLDHVGKINSTYRSLVRALQKALLGDKSAMDPFKTMEWLHHSWGNGPMWTRELAKETYSKERLESMLKLLNSRKLVIGHTPTEDRQIKPLYGGKVFNIDTGISRAVTQGNLSAMVFHKNGRYDTYNKIHRSTFHPVAQAIRQNYQRRPEVTTPRAVWNCFTQVALREGVLSAYVR